MPDGAGTGPLSGVTVVELAGIGPAPYAAMLLADLGADVIRVERPGSLASGVPPEVDVLRRSRRSIIVDLRRPEGVQVVLALVSRSDVLLEGLRPGVVERLGLGPEACWERNPRLVFGRMTGWGQTGPLAHSAGHDIGYIAVTGALHAVGRPDAPPTVPLNLVGDFGGGSTFLVIGVLAALWEAGRSSRGQVVDAAIVDGASSLTAMMHGMLAAGGWSDRRGVNLLDSGRPWYDVYETSDGRWMAVGALEPQFYAAFMSLLGLTPDEAERADERAWPRLRQQIADVLRQRTRDEWADVFEGTDACVAPVLSMGEAPSHPHLVARGTFIDVGGVRQPAPAPRFSRSVAPWPQPPAAPGAHTVDVLRSFGVPDVEGLLRSGVVVQAS